MKNLIPILVVVLFSAKGFGQDDKTWWKNMFSKETTEKNETESGEPDAESTPEKIEVKEPTENQNIPMASKQNGSGGVVWVMPDKLNLLNDSLVKSPPAVKGFRVVIFAGPLDAAKKFRSDFVQKNPDVPCYLQHAAPNFEVRIGNCREKPHAFQLLNDYSLLFPGAYVVKDDIEFPPLPTP